MKLILMLLSFFEEDAMQFGSVTNNEFKGKSDSLTLLSGFIDCVQLIKRRFIIVFLDI